MRKTIASWANNGKRLLAIACLFTAPLMAGLLATGCAGDRYHESTGESIDDSAITARIKAALDHDAVFKYDNVHVSTFKGTAQLSGFVVSQDAKNHATDVAKNVAGVRDVNNSIDLQK